jgi:hypothetical protein
MICNDDGLIKNIKNNWMDLKLKQWMSNKLLNQRHELWMLLEINICKLLNISIEYVQFDENKNWNNSSEFIIKSYFFNIWIDQWEIDNI